jgi:PAT family beta-lactamase induction signal transducer AmpG
LPHARPLPPVWLMGIGFLPLGAFGSLMLITFPALLATNHVPEGRIAAITAIGLIPGFVYFLLSPILDWRFKRRSYAIGLAIVGGACMYAAFLCITNLVLLPVLLFVGYLAVSLCIAAVGGWFGNLAQAHDKDRLGAWFTVFNLGGGGAVAMSAIALVRGLPYALGAGLISLSVVAALPLFFWLPCPPADKKLASESFRDFARDVTAVLRKGSVLWTLPLFLLPSAAFALTNTLGGLGHDFNTSETLVGLIGGGGVTLGGVLGSLLIPPLANRLPPRPLYLMVGICGALFSLSLILAPRVPAVFGLALLGENVFQAGAFSVANVIALRANGADNPLAATQFGLLIAATGLPLIYMQYLDGQAYGLGGVNGTLLNDAGLSGGACLVMALVFWLFRKRVPMI